jgi:D-3-phosphoglycerate dehydrogenase
MNHRIFITGTRIADAALHLLHDRQCLVEVGDPKDTPEDLVRKLALFNPDGLIVRQGRITGAVQDAPKRLRVICKHGVGTDNIEVAEATRRGIPVLFTPGTNAESVAEHALALILSLTRRIPLQDRRIRSGVYEKATYDGQELLGATLGLVGFGRIARRLCDLVAPFDVRVLAYHPSCTVEALPGHVAKAQHLEELLPQADVLSLHCPLSPATRGLVDGRTIAMMKRGVYIVNTARGGLIDESDLAEALRSGQIGGAALDVLKDEPPAEGSPLLGLDNVILTPHVGGASDRSMVNMGLQAARNVLAVLEGEPVDLRSVLNGEVLGGGTADGPSS